MNLEMKVTNLGKILASGTFVRARNLVLSGMSLLLMTPRIISPLFRIFLPPFTSRFHVTLQTLHYTVRCFWSLPHLTLQLLHIRVVQCTSTKITFSVFSPKTRDLSITRFTTPRMGTLMRPLK